MSNCPSLISITIILSTIIAPTFSGTLYASGGSITKTHYYSINQETQNAMVVTEDVQDSGAVIPRADIAYNCITEEIWASTGGLRDSSSWKIEGVAPDGNLVAGTVQSLNERHGALEFVGSTLYGWSNTLGGLTIIDPATGVVTPISRELNTFPMLIPGLAYDIYTNTMYAVAMDNPRPANAAPSWLVSIDLGTGLPTFIAPTGVTSFTSLAFGDNGVLYGSTSANVYQIYTINTETGQSTPFSKLPDVGGQTSDYILGLTYIPDNGCLSKQPTSNPTNYPTVPTTTPTTTPTKAPTTPTKAPTNPTKGPTKSPTKAPTKAPTNPTKAPTNPTKTPTESPTGDDDDDSDGSSGSNDDR